MQLLEPFLLSAIAAAQCRSRGVIIGHPVLHLHDFDGSAVKAPFRQHSLGQVVMRSRIKSDSQRNQQQAEQPRRNATRNNSPGETDVWRQV